MCGIFGFSLKHAIPVSKAFEVLEKLEVHQYPFEPFPLGGYGAGIALLGENGSFEIEKIGSTDDLTPVKHLAKSSRRCDTRVLLGHVRLPSKEFMATAGARETAQPYVVGGNSESTIASIHNGLVQNYKELRAKLRGTRIFESEKAELIDSEVIPHVFAEILGESHDTDKALYQLSCAIEGSNAIALLHVDKGKAFLHFVHKGKTRGLIVWTNDQEEVVFCTRKEPLTEDFNAILNNGGFKERISIGYHEDLGLKLSCPVIYR